MKNDGGSYRKDPAEKVTQQMKVYVTETEEAELKANAETLGMSFSSFARAVLTEQELEADPQELQRIRYELNKIGVNINQLARKANESGRLPEARRLEALADRLITKLQQL